jgi:phage I-like protein
MILDTNKLGSFLLANVGIGPRDDEIVIIPSGAVELFGEDDILMDASAAKTVIEQFNDRGVKIPIDYEHSTLYKAGQGEPSPAAGWITALRFDPAVGLIGTVEWGDKARQQIKDREYRYLSPHFRIDTATRRVDHVLAVALTNTPRINNMRELVAASVAAAIHKPGDTAQEDSKMAKKLIERLASALKLEDEATEDQVVAAVEQAVAQAEEAPAAPTGEEAAAMAAKDALMTLQSVLMEAGLLGPDATLADAAQAAVDLVGKSAEGANEAASIAASLGIEAKDKATLVAAINAKIAGSVPAEDAKALQDRVAKLEAEKTDREVTTLVGSLVEDGKLNPHDADKMAWARKQARENRAAFTELMAHAPVLYKSDRETPNETTPSGRDTVIASAVNDYAQEKCGASKRWYVNAALDEKGLEHLNDEEAKKHQIG